MQPPLHPSLFHSNSQDARCTPVCLSLVSRTQGHFIFTYPPISLATLLLFSCPDTSFDYHSYQCFFGTFLNIFCVYYFFHPSFSVFFLSWDSWDLVWESTLIPSNFSLSLAYTFYLHLPLLDLGYFNTLPSNWPTARQRKKKYPALALL